MSTTNGQKKVFYREAAYPIGILLLSFGTALMTEADFGLSMVVAPAYLIHLKVSQTLSFYTFGMSEYIFQGVLLCFLALLMRRFKLTYLLSFVTAFIYGQCLDVWMKVVSLFTFEGIAWRVFCYIAGLVLGSAGVAFIFHTYLTPEVYELFVKEFCARFHTPLDRTKIVYDCCSALLGIILSFAFFGFGRFVGISWGTIICAIVNGWLIGRICDRLDAVFVFKDRFKHNSDLF